MNKVNSKDWIYIDNTANLCDILDPFSSVKVLAIDTETTGLNPHTNELRLIQMAAEGLQTVVLDCFKIFPDAIDQLRKVFDSPSVKVFQNAKFDLQFLMSAGISVKGPIFDTMLAAQLLRTSGGPRRAGLGVLAEHYLGQNLPKEEQVSDFSGELRESQLEYAARDASILLLLRNTMIHNLTQNELIEVARIEFACSYAIADVEHNGIYLDIKKWEALTKKTEAVKQEALEELYPYIGYPIVQLGFLGESVSQGFNLDSSKQVLQMLNNNDVNVESTSKHALSRHSDNPIVQSLQKYRHAKKALSSFLYSMPKQINKKTGRLHPRYGQMGAGSGRMSCGGPNIQQIPRGKDFRGCFVAPKGRKIIIADYSQIELRVIAEISSDNRMITAYKNGEDLHTLTASLVAGKDMKDITKKERQAAKAVNFGLVYGMGAEGLKDYSCETYGVDMTIDEAHLFKKRFFEGYRGVETWHKMIRQNSPSVSRTLAGRKHLYGQNSSLSGRYNTPVQGSAADIIKNALGMLHLKLKGTNTHIIAVVHDEIVLECDALQAENTLEMLTTIMEDAGNQYTKEVPITAEGNITDSWAEK